MQCGRVTANILLLPAVNSCRPQSLMLCLFSLEWTHKKHYLDFFSNSLIYYHFIAEHIFSGENCNVDLSTNS